MWFHIKCEGITDEIYKCLNVGGDQVHWYCKSCNNKALDAMKLIQGFKEKIDVFEARIDSFTSQVENLTLMKGSFAEKLREMINEEVDEIKEKDMRKCNVVLSNIPEQTEHEDNVETTVNVPDTVKELVHSVLRADDIQIISTNRVPSSRKHGGSNTSNHKIMVKLESLNPTDCKKLRHEERWNKVFINPDLTVKEREMHFELKQQLKQRKENGERNLVIDRGRIVHYNKKSSNPESF